MKFLLFTLLLIWPVTKENHYAGLDMPVGTFSLTFDDGPSERTLKILDILDKYNIKATFFVVSGMAKGKEWIVQEEITRGHTVGCHTVTHPLMTRLSSIRWKQEIDQCVKDLEKITGQRVGLFRFPYGSSTWEMEEYANSKGLKTVLWNIDSLDWKKGPKEELEHLKWGIDKQKRGVILMHDLQKSTVESLEFTIEYMIEKKANFVRLGP